MTSVQRPTVSYVTVTNFKFLFFFDKNKTTTTSTTVLSTTTACYTTVGITTSCSGKKKRSISDSPISGAENRADMILPTSGSRQKRSDNRSNKAMTSSAMDQLNQVRK